MSFSNDASERKRASKVTICPVSSGDTNALIVSIRKISAEIPEEDIPKVTSTFKNVPEISSSLNMASKDSKHALSNKEKSSTPSQTARHDPMSSKADSPPCLKHAAQNLSRKASEVPSEKIKLCNDCSKSMLSYIFLVQDFLDSLAREIKGDKDSECLQCIRQEVRDNAALLPDDSTVIRATNKDSVHRTHSDYSQNRTKDKDTDSSSDRTRSKRTARTKGHRQESKKYADFHKDVQSSSQSFPHQQNPKVEFIYNVSPPEQTDKTISAGTGDSRTFSDYQSSSNQNQQNEGSPAGFSRTDASVHAEPTPTSKPSESNTCFKPSTDESSFKPVAGDTHFQQSDDSGSRHIDHTQTSYHSEDQHSHQQTHESAPKTSFPTPIKRVQPDYDVGSPDNRDKNGNFSVQQSPSLFSEDVDGIVSTLSNAEREIYDSARNGAGWEGLTEPSNSGISSEAFVTSCRNNAEAIGCLAVGTSLLLCRTSRKLCVLVSDGVSTAFRSALSSVFHTVQYIRSLDSLGTTKLALLEQPELGITFDKLNVWRLTQYSKCVYLNPDTLVIQNCDELFRNEELSAVPDIGWPDCFNSGVFIFSPSTHTFWQLLEFAEKQGSYDGGDQGLLNSYFNSWSSDIHKKLSFIYNLMANVSYTYTPAFRQFGRNVKIVQFHGSFKPWHVKFFTNSGQVSPASPVHPTYIQFVHIWLKIFRISVLRLMSQEIQSYAAKQEIICAVEILRFFPLPTESEADFFLTPPSVRLRLAEMKLNRSVSLPLSEAQRRKSAEFPRYTNTEDETTNTKPALDIEQETKIDSADSLKSESIASPVDEEAKDNSRNSELDTDEVFSEKVEKKDVVDENALPGAEVGNYQGMKAWEQGRMDYQGVDSSDNVIKRLQFLMSKPD